MNSIIGGMTHVIKTEVEPGAIKYVNYESNKCKMTAYWDMLGMYNHIKTVDFSKCTENEIRGYIRREFRSCDYSDENDGYRIFKAQKNKLGTKHNNLQLHKDLVPLKMVDGIRRGK